MLTCQTAVWLCLATADDDDDDDFDGENEDGFVDYGPANDGGGSGDAPGGDGFNDGSGNDHGYNIDDAHEPHVMSGLRFLGWGLLAATRGARHDDGSGGFAVRPYTSTAEMHATRASFQTQTRRAMNPGPGLHMRRRLGRFGAPGHPETCVITGKSPKMSYSFVGRAWVAARQFARRDEDDRDRHPTASVIRRVSIQTHTHRGFPHEPRREHRVEPC